jgi:hypothetical protein
LCFVTLLLLFPDGDDVQAVHSFVIPVVDVCNSLLRVRVHDADNLDAASAVSHGLIAVSSLFDVGGRMPTEISRW